MWRESDRRNAAPRAGVDFSGLPAKFRASKIAVQRRWRPAMSNPVDDRDDEAPKHEADLVSKLYIAFGVPAIIAFMVILFAFTRWFNIPA
jgi:hypothetical protein